MVLWVSDGNVDAVYDVECKGGSGGEYDVVC